MCRNEFLHSTKFRYLLNGWIVDTERQIPTKMASWFNISLKTKGYTVKCVIVATSIHPTLMHDNGLRQWIFFSLAFSFCATCPFFLLFNLSIGFDWAFHICTTVILCAKGKKSNNEKNHSYSHHFTRDFSNKDNTIYTYIYYIIFFYIYIYW